jgi:D-alanine-D-alanine ligase-like ATP-grasp enzyme
VLLLLSHSLSNRPVVRLVYDIGDQQYPEANQQIALLFEQCGYRWEEHFISESNFEDELRSIPRDALVFNGVVNNTSAPHEPFRLTRYVEQSFPRTIGPPAEFSENCQFKSVMYELFQRHGVPMAPYCLLKAADELDDPNVKNTLDSIGVPVFVKTDNGSNSEGVRRKRMKGKNENNTDRLPSPVFRLFIVGHFD